MRTISHTTPINTSSIVAVLQAALERFALFEQCASVSILKDTAFGDGNFLLINGMGKAGELQEMIRNGQAEEALALGVESQDHQVLHALYEAISEQRSRGLLKGDAEHLALIFPKSDFMLVIQGMRACAKAKEIRKRMINRQPENA